MNRLQEQISEQILCVYPFSVLFADVRTHVLSGWLARMEKTNAQDFERIFARQYPAVRGLKHIGAPLPAAFTAVAAFVITGDLCKELQQPVVDINAVEELLEDARFLGLTLDKHKLSPVIQQRLENYANAFKQEPTRPDLAVKLVEFISYMETFHFDPDYTRTQLLVFEGLEKLPPETLQKDIYKALTRKLKISLDTLPAV